MVWAVSTLPRNGSPPLDEFDQTERVGSRPWCGQQARCPGTGIFRLWAAVERPWPTTPMVSMLVKIVKLQFAKKKVKKKRSDVELRRDSAYDSNDRSTYGSVCTMAMIWGKS
jgi:hypothetical protein